MQKKPLRKPTRTESRGITRRLRGLERTSLNFDRTDRTCLERLQEMLGLRKTEVVRLALRKLAYDYRLLPIEPIPEDLSRGDYWPRARVE